jgi:PAS domain S-box-containing protein
MSVSDVDLIGNEAFKEIFQGMSEGIIMVDTRGKVVVANSVAEQLFGYNSGELTGVMLEELLPARYRKGHVNFRNAFNSNPFPRRMGAGRDLMALRKDGTEFPVEISLSFTKVKNELLVMAFISDITLRKTTEDALKRSEEQLIVYASELEKKVEMRTDALNNTILKLEEEVYERKKAEEEARKSLAKERELNELKTKFVSLASHEFRTPLSAVLSSAALIKQYNNRQELDKIDKHVQRIKASVNQLTGILNDFLSLGKLEEGRIDVVREPIDPQKFLDEISEEIGGMLKEGQRLVVDCRRMAPEFVGDSRILRNILFNLVTNAIKYSDVNTTIYITAYEQEGSIAFDVRDQGIGIPEEDQKHLFDRFFRASNAGNVQGTGLGLNIVRRYLDLLDGSISFSSNYGEGTTFKIIIPVTVNGFTK